MGFTHELTTFQELYRLLANGYETPGIDRARYASTADHNYMDSIVDYIYAQTNALINIPAILSCHYLGWIIG